MTVCKFPTSFGVAAKRTGHCGRWVPLRRYTFFDCATRGLLATDHVILNHGQVTWTTPELAPPLLTTTPHQRENVSALDRFNVHRCPTRRVFSGTGIELVTRQATIRYLYHSATAATSRSVTHDLKTDVTVLRWLGTSLEIKCQLKQERHVCPS
ncbi:uncharacterized protein TNCV_3964991 [Trichonephila clavipes]|nr:uncharacterized protein TNCV_3964991 [Trichonephila clavipes]